MPHGDRVFQLTAEGFRGAQPGGALTERRMLQALAGYILERPSASPRPGTVRTWGYLLVVAGPLGGPEAGRFPTTPRSSSGLGHAPLRLRPVGRLVPVAALRPTPDASADGSLRPVPSGQCYRITSAPARGLVTAELAAALASVLEEFSRGRGFTPEQPLEVRLTRGFKAGSHGHGEGRAADIAAVAGKSLLEWKRAWDHAMATAEALSDPARRAGAISAEQKRNLGYGLYKALQEHGGWRVDPEGWRPYRGVMQLFGPWTAVEGPWTTMQLKHPTSYQRQRLADQQWVFRAHHDHIHVAR